MDLHSSLTYYHLDVKTLVKLPWLKIFIWTYVKPKNIGT